MDSALILYHSRTGTTAAYSQNIGSELSARGIRVSVLPLYKAADAPVAEADTIFLGCWTSGLLFFLQRPEKVWEEYVKRLPDITDKEIVLFTTYKFLTGSMFREMQKRLPDGTRVSLIKLKSRSDTLSASNKELIHLLINN